MRDIAFDALEQAAHWFATLSAEHVTPDEQRQWQAWLAADEEHRLAWERVEKVGQEFGLLKEAAAPAPAMQALDAARDGRLLRRRSLKALLLCITGAAAWRGSRSDAARTVWWQNVAQYATGTGEMRHVVLADGTRIWLNTLSAFDPAFDRAWRRVHLRSGEVLIETAKDAARPFVADTRHGSLRAIGTRFMVRQREDCTVLSVFEGAVEIAPSASALRLVVPAGQSVAFDAQHIDAAVPLHPASPSWARGVLLADHTRLADFINELARYARGHLGCDPAVAELRISGVFPLNDIDKTFNMLSAALPVEVKYVLPWWGTVQAVGAGRSQK